MSAEDDLYAKWLKWPKTIQNETHTLWLYRDYQRGLSEMTENDDIPPTTFFHALGVWYAAAQMTGVRRQLDRDTRSVSLWRLLTDMADHPEVMTRERHVSLWFDDDDDEIDRELKTADANSNYEQVRGRLHFCAEGFGAAAADQLRGRVRHRYRQALLPKLHRSLRDRRQGRPRPPGMQSPGRCSRRRGAPAETTSRGV